MNSEFKKLKEKLLNNIQLTETEVHGIMRRFLSRNRNQ